MARSPAHPVPNRKSVEGSGVEATESEVVVEELSSMSMVK